MACHNSHHFIAVLRYNSMCMCVYASRTDSESLQHQNLMLILYNCCFHYHGCCCYCFCCFYCSRKLQTYLCQKFVIRFTNSIVGYELLLHTFWCCTTDSQSQMAVCVCMLKVFSAQLLLPLCARLSVWQTSLRRLIVVLMLLFVCNFKVKNFLSHLGASESQIQQQHKE